MDCEVGDLAEPDISLEVFSASEKRRWNLFNSTDKVCKHIACKVGDLAEPG